MDFVIPDGLLRFTSSDGSINIAIDPIEAVEEIERISEECNGKPDYTMSILFGDWIAGKTGVRFPIGQSDGIMQIVIKEYRRNRRDFLNALGSLDSTGSTSSG